MDPTKFPNLDPEITADELVEKIKEDEDAQRFIFKEWYNDIDQEIFMYGLDDGSIKIVDLLWVDDFLEWHTIFLKRKTARGRSPPGPSTATPFNQASVLILSMFDSKKKFTLMNATHEKLFFEVRYAAESQRVKSEATEKNFGVGVSAEEIGGNFDMGWQSTVTKEVNYCQDLDTVEDYNLDAHCSKKVRKSSKVIYFMILFCTFLTKIRSL